MSSSEKDSPDWLRSHKPPGRSVVTLSSDSESSHEGQSPSEEYLPGPEKIHSEFSLSSEEVEGQKKKKSSINESKLPLKIDSNESRIYTKQKNTNERSKGKSAEGKASKKVISQQHFETHESDSLPIFRSEGNVPEDVVEKSTENPPTKRQKIASITEEEEESISNVKGADHAGVPEEELEMRAEPIASSATMPLVLPEKVQRLKVLVECEADSIDMSGDMGAVGRVMISDVPSGREMFLDLKGQLWSVRG